MTTQTGEAYEGLTVVGSDGSKIGKIGDVYYNEETGQAEWVSVKTGMFGSKEALVPLPATAPDGDTLTVPYDKDMVKDAPHRDADGELSSTDVIDLYTYYGIAYTTGTETTSSHGEAAIEGQPSTAAPDMGGVDTDDAMTRSEERLQVGTQAVETGNVKLRKRIVTEDVTRTVPVSHEEVVVERDPITEPNVGNATDGPDLQEAETELTLHADQPVVAKETVAVGRVRLGSETVTENAQVTESVRHEEIDTNTDSAP